MLQLREVSKTFFAGTPNEVQALKGVSLQIDDGSFVTVIGTNGSGKSTLLNAVAGAFPLDRGSITLAIECANASRADEWTRSAVRTTRMTSVIDG